MDVIPRKFVGNRITRKTNLRVCNYDNRRIRVFGTVRIKCTSASSGKNCWLNFIAVNDKHTPILGRKSSEALGVIRRIDLVENEAEPFLCEKYAECFDGLGAFPGTVKINLREGLQPKVHYRKRFPFSVLSKLKGELLKMETQGIISSVDYPTDWVNNIVCVEKKSGRLRICLDPRPLNECIRREIFPIPTIEDLTANLAGKQVFSILDLEAGFWHMVLDQESADLTKFITPFGRYRFHRVPFGINCAPELFQRKMIQIFGDIPGVVIYFDDVLIRALSEEEHDKIIEKVMKRARESGVKFNRSKIQYKDKKVEFMGNVISGEGVEPLNKYKDAILEMETPSIKDAVSRFLG